MNSTNHNHTLDQVVTSCILSIDNPKLSLTCDVLLRTISLEMTHLTTTNVLIACHETLANRPSVAAIANWINSLLLLLLVVVILCPSIIFASLVVVKSLVLLLLWLRLRLIVHKTLLLFRLFNLSLGP